MSAPGPVLVGFDEDGVDEPELDFIVVTRVGISAVEVDADEVPGLPSKVFAFVLGTLGVAPFSVLNSCPFTKESPGDNS